MLTLGTLQLSFLLKAYVVSRNEINSFKFSGPGSYNYFEFKNRTKNFTQSLLHRKKAMSLLCLSALSRNKRYVTDCLVLLLLHCKKKQHYDV